MKKRPKGAETNKISNLMEIVKSLIMINFTDAFYENRPKSTKFII